MTQKKKRPTEEQKKKLDNSKVPSVTLKGAVRAASNGDFEEADRRWNLVKEHNDKLMKERAIRERMDELKKKKK